MFVFVKSARDHLPDNFRKSEEVATATDTRFWRPMLYQLNMPRMLALRRPALHHIIYV